MSRPNLYRRIFFFLLGLSLSGLGVAICTRSGLGTTPISSLPYVLSFISSLSLGAWTVLLNTLFVLLQMAILGREFPKLQFLQMAAVVVFGAFIDLGMAVFGLFRFESYPLRFLELFAGCAVMAFGISLQALSDVMYVPGEGLVKSICKRFGFAFGSVKIGLDSTLTVCALLLSLIVLGCVQGLREGTVFAALAVGFLVKIFIARFRFLKLAFYAKHPFARGA